MLGFLCLSRLQQGFFFSLFFGLTIITDFMTPGGIGFFASSTEQLWFHGSEAAVKASCWGIE